MVTWVHLLARFQFPGRKGGPSAGQNDFLGTWAFVARECAEANRLSSAHQTTCDSQSPGRPKQKPRAADETRFQNISKRLANITLTRFVTVQKYSVALCESHLAPHGLLQADVKRREQIPRAAGLGGALLLFTGPKTQLCWGSARFLTSPFPVSSFFPSQFALLISAWNRW